MENQVTRILHNTFLDNYLFDYNSSSLLIYYKGSFSNKVLEKIGKFLKKDLIPFPRLNKKIFAIFIELAQNIGRYSSEANFFGQSDNHNTYNEGIGSFALYETPNTYVLSTGNLVNNYNTKKIIDSFNKINTLDYSELRKLKKEILNAPKVHLQKGANIGFIQIALKSEKPIKFDIQDINTEYSYIVLTFNIKKNAAK